jgi:hypothetical protein
VAALELVAANQLGDERDAADAPDIAGRQGHLEEQMGESVEERFGKDDHR